MNEPYLYQTFKQFKPDGGRPVYIQVIHIVMKEGKRVRLDLLNLDGKLDVAEIEPQKFGELVGLGVIQEWRP